MLDSLHRRVNTEGPTGPSAISHSLATGPQQLGQPSRNLGGMAGVQANNNYSHGKILVDEDALDDAISDSAMQHHHQHPGAPAATDTDDFGIDGLDVEQLRQLMRDPHYAALFAAHCKNLIVKTYVRQRRWRSVEKKQQRGHARVRL